MIDFADSPDHLEPSATAATFNGVRWSTRIIPAADAARGGDWCEAFAVSAHVIALSVGDVCGHGSEKFATMVAVRENIRASARTGWDPALVLALANAALQRCDPDETATAFFGLLDTRKRTLVFANAGHPPLLMVGPLGALFVNFAESDVPMGVDAALVPMLHTLHTPPATLFVLYTDGVTDRDRLTARGEAQLLAAAETAYGLPAVPAADVVEKRMLLTGFNRDDAAVLTVRTPSRPIDRKTHARRRTADGMASRAFATMYASARALQ